MKHCKKAILILLCISTIISFISCDGANYYTRLASYSELTNDLLSAEIITGYDSSNISVVKILDIERVKCDLLTKIAEQELLCCGAPASQKYTSVYRIRLNYADYTLIFDEFAISHFDASGNFSRWRTKSHSLLSNDNYRNTILSFLDEELN